MPEIVLLLIVVLVVLCAQARISGTLAALGTAAGAIGSAASGALGAAGLGGAGSMVAGSLGTLGGSAGLAGGLTGAAGSVGLGGLATGTGIAGGALGSLGTGATGLGMMSSVASSGLQMAGQALSEPKELEFTTPPETLKTLEKQRELRMEDINQEASESLSRQKQSLVSSGLSGTTAEAAVERDVQEWEFAKKQKALAQSAEQLRRAQIPTYEGGPSDMSRILGAGARGLQPIAEGIGRSMGKEQAWQDLIGGDEPQSKTEPNPSSGVTSLAADPFGYTQTPVGVPGSVRRAAMGLGY